MITGIDVPLELAVALTLAAGVLGAWLGKRLTNRRLDPRRDPLRPLMQPAAFAEAISLANHRNAMRAASRAVLHGQLDHLAGLRNAWTPDTHDQVREHVAAVMRAGLRRDDRVSLGEGDGFTIVIEGADERAAMRIADRLRRSLARLRLPQISSTSRLSASFGVAAGRPGDNADDLVRKARRALQQALVKGEAHVVSASELEEVIFLPPPAAAAPPPAASVA